MKIENQLKIGDWIRDIDTGYTVEIKTLEDIADYTPDMGNHYEIVANYSGFNRFAIIVGLLIILATLLREAMN